MKEKVLGNFKNPVVGIIGGTGAMGLLFKKFFESQGYSVLVSARHTELSAVQLVKQSDVIIYTVPINKTIEVIKETAMFAREGSVLTDLTSLKKDSVKAMEKYSKKQVEVVGMHPLFGPNVLNFEKQTIVLCQARGHNWFKWLRKHFRKAKAKVRIISPEEHDDLMAIIQAMRHFSLISYGKTLSELNVPLKQLISYSTPQSYVQLMNVSKLLNQDAELFADIELLNPNFKKILHKYFDSIQKLKKIVERNDKKAFIKFFNESKSFFAELNGEKTEAKKSKKK